MGERIDVHEIFRLEASNTQREEKNFLRNVNPNPSLARGGVVSLGVPNRRKTEGYDIGGVALLAKSPPEVLFCFHH